MYKTEYQMTEWVEMTPFFSYSWAYNHSISLLKLTGADRPTVDAWLDYSMQVRHEWAKDAPLLVLSDCRQSDFINTPYFRQSVPKLMATRPELKTYSAFVLDKSLGARTMEVAVRMMRPNDTLEGHVFYNVEDGINWLLEHANS
jgi:hypothetical protein